MYIRHYTSNFILDLFLSLLYDNIKCVKIVHFSPIDKSFLSRCSEYNFTLLSEMNKNVHSFDMNPLEPLHNNRILK